MSHSFLKPVLPAETNHYKTLTGDGRGPYWCLHCQCFLGWLRRCPRWRGLCRRWRWRPQSARHIVISERRNLSFTLYSPLFSAVQQPWQNVIVVVTQILSHLWSSRGKAKVERRRCLRRLYLQQLQICIRSKPGRFRSHLISRSHCDVAMSATAKTHAQESLGGTWRGDSVKLPSPTRPIPCCAVPAAAQDQDKVGSFCAWLQSVSSSAKGLLMSQQCEQLACQAMPTCSRIESPKGSVARYLGCQ